MSWIAKLTLAITVAAGLSGCVVHDRYYGHRGWHEHRCYDCRRW